MTVSSLAMPPDHKFAVRIVIQRLGSGRQVTWRVVGYGGNRAFGHSDFSSRADLLHALHLAIPGLDSATLSLDEARDGAPSILFTGDMELSYPQLAVLGLG